MKILLLGAHGQLGNELKKFLPELGELTALSRKDLDLTNLSDLKFKLNSLKPEIIINASAYTAVDKAETEIDLATLINARVPEILAQYSAENSAILVHYSTDYVFDGKQKTPYIETDEPNPLSVYGLSKLQGEQKILETNCKHLIFRTSWLFSAYGENFMNTIIRLAHEREKLEIISDQWGSPTSCIFLAEITIQALKLSLEETGISKSTVWGIYNATSSGVTNWFDFACLIVSKIKTKSESLKIDLKKIYPIKTEDYYQKAVRPRYSCLSTSKLETVFSIPIMGYEYYLANEINKIAL